MDIFDLSHAVHADVVGLGRGCHIARISNVWVRWVSYIICMQQQCHSPPKHCIMYWCILQQLFFFSVTTTGRSWAVACFLMIISVGQYNLDICIFCSCMDRSPYCTHPSTKPQDYGLWNVLYLPTASMSKVGSNGAIKATYYSAVVLIGKLPPDIIATLDYWLCQKKCGPGHWSYRSRQ